MKISSKLRLPTYFKETAMWQFKVDDEHYILPLDSLDLSNLSQCVEQADDEKKLLWSMPSLAKKEYYQVQLVSAKLQVENPCIEQFKSYVCDICNMAVPETYFKQHNKSSRHQNCRILVDRILENVSRQIDIDIDEIPCKKPNKTFYCEPCCKVVALINKGKHKKSKYHLKCLEDEKLISKFVQLYNDNDKLNSQYSENLYENNSDSECCSSVKSDYCNSSPSKNENLDIDNSKVDSNDISLTISRDDEVKYFHQYLKEMTAKYKLDYKLPIVKYNSVFVVTPSGFKEQITIDAFHSYKKMDGFAFCLLCQKWVQDNIKKHETSEEHVRNIFQPINDTFARKMLNDNRYSHCLICNEKVLNTANHVNARPKHKKYLQSNASN